MKINKMFQTIDTHVAGEPLRIIVDGLPEIKGETQLQRREYCMKNLDHIRELLMYEPRGHHGMYGCIITPPAESTSDFGVLFMHNEGWSTMCGHGIIAVITVGIEMGRLEFKSGMNKFMIDSPAGEITAYANVEDNKVDSVSFENVPSFVLKRNVPLNIDGKSFTADISFGGAFYAIVNSKEIGLEVTKKDLSELQKWGTEIKKQIEKDYEIVHPLEKGLTGMYGVIFSDTPSDKEADLKNVTIFADAQIDRSPCGTGTSARLASLYENNQIKQDDSFVHESITGGKFTGKMLEETKVANFDAVKPLVTGAASITGFHQFVIEPEDALPKGFLLEE